MENKVFAVQVFFIIFRECLEAGIIISVLLAFLKQCFGGKEHDQTVYKRLRKELWLGALSGIVICLIIGGAFIGVFYGLGKDLWAKSEELWEGIFYLVAAIIISIMGLAMLRVNKMQAKWRVKIAKSLAEKTTSTTAAVTTTNSKRAKFADWNRRHIIFIIPFITVLREGLEAVVFIGGVSLGLPASSFPLPVITGALAAGVISYIIYRGGNVMSVRIFLIASTSLLYLIAAGMFSKSIWNLQYYVFAKAVGGDVAESGNGPGSYNIRQTVWHVNCCNPETEGGWMVFGAILGWQNTATYGSVISYNVYWLALIVTICCLMYEERTGSLPLKEKTLSVLARVPGLGGYIKKKRAVHEQDAAELYGRIQPAALTGSS